MPGFIPKKNNHLKFNIKTLELDWPMATPETGPHNPRAHLKWSKWRLSINPLIATDREGYFNKFSGKSGSCTNMSSCILSLFGKCDAIGRTTTSLLQITGSVLSRAFFKPCSSYIKIKIQLSIASTCFCIFFRLFISFYLFIFNIKL
jgi:hypothetical protein